MGKPRKFRTEPHCANKRRYVTDVEARAAAMASLEHHGGPDKLWVYRCKDCDGWHLTKAGGYRWLAVTRDNPVLTVAHP